VELAVWVRLAAMVGQADTVSNSSDNGHAQYCLVCAAQLLLSTVYFLVLLLFIPPV
jgi:hypothetical protein